MDYTLPYSHVILITKTTPWGGMGASNHTAKRDMGIPTRSHNSWENFCVFFSQASVKSNQKIGEYQMRKPANGNDKIINFPKKQDSIGIQDLSQQIEHLMEFFEAEGVMIVLKKG